MITYLISTDEQPSADFFQQICSVNFFHGGCFLKNFQETLFTTITKNTAGSVFLKNITVKQKKTNNIALTNILNSSFPSTSENSSLSNNTLKCLKLLNQNFGKPQTIFNGMGTEFEKDVFH